MSWFARLRELMAYILSLLRRVTSLFLWLLLFAALLTRDTPPPINQLEKIRLFTRPYEFDYSSWMVNAMGIKIDQSNLGTSLYLSPDARHDKVIAYLKLVDQIQRVEGQINDIYSNPNIANPEAASLDLRKQLAGLIDQRNKLAPLAESILQDQVSQVAAEQGLTLGGQPIPPVLYHVTPLPLALIVSPRNEIKQIQDISLLPDLTVEQQAKLEDEVDKTLNVSSLIVPVGGVGIYPTMVQQTTDLNWQANTVAHEWTHNYLTLRPLGFDYAFDFNSTATPAIRVINETTASISGGEIGSEVINRFYPEFAPKPQPAQPAPSTPAPQQPPKPPAFDFNNEMHITRLEVDKLLAAGKIDEAEAYMEQRRIVFWDHGYHIRKLNQAYFAFYGAYASEPGGASGGGPSQEELIGADVRLLRQKSPSLAVFLNRIAWITSFAQLQALLKGQ